MVGSWRLLSAGINTSERPAAMSKVFVVEKKVETLQKIEEKSWEKVL